MPRTIPSGPRQHVGCFTPRAFSQRTTDSGSFAAFGHTMNSPRRGVGSLFNQRHTPARRRSHLMARSAPMASDIHERLLALAADARKQARQLREDARAAVEQADKLETMAALWESQVGERRDLTARASDNTLDTVNASPQTNAQRSHAKFSEPSLSHPFVRAFLKAGESLPKVKRRLERAWFKKHGTRRKFARTTIQAWVRADDDPLARRIHEEVADLIEAEYGVARSAWPRVIPRLD